MKFTQSALVVVAASTLAAASVSVTNVNGNDNKVTTTQTTKVKAGKRDLYTRSLLSLVKREPEYQEMVDTLSMAHPSRQGAQH